MKELLKFRSMGPVGSDETSEIYFDIVEKCTVKELCDYIIANDKDWGYIGLDSHSHGSLFGEPNIEYMDGHYVDKDRNPIEFNFPEEIANKTVESIRAHGGWSRLDYLLTVE